MTVHFFVKGGPTTPSSRLRAWLVAEELRKRGIDAIVHDPAISEISETPWPRKLALITAAVRALFSVRKDDVTYFQRAIYNKYFFIALLTHRLLIRRKTVFDLDDAIYLHSPIKSVIMARLSDAVVAGSHETAAWSRKHSKRVELIPTSLPLERFAAHVRSYVGTPKPLVLGWTGNGPAHFESLLLLVPVFEELLRRGTDFRFVLIGAFGEPRIRDLFTRVRGLKTDILDRLPPDEVPARIKEFTFGLMPLVDTPWNRGRCALKALEYMACGVPAIASSVGESAHVIANGVNGFLAAGAAEWADAAESALRNPESLPAMSRAALETVRSSYSYEANIPKLIALLKSL